MLLTARWVVPVTSSPIQDGAVRIRDEIILDVGSKSSLLKNNDEEIVDLGESVLLPGLVNAHAHLEFGSGEKKTSFTDWARTMTQGEHKGSPLHDRINSLLRGGTTTIADHCDPAFVGAPLAASFRRIPFWEILGAEKSRAQASLQQALERQKKEGGFVTPHSLYAVHRDVLDELAGAALRGRPPLKGNHGELPLQSIHILESSDEDQFFRNGSGPLADFVRERSGEIPFPEKLPVRWLLGKMATPHRILLVHANYLTFEEMDLLSGTGISIVHCPGSHRYFGHRRFPLEELQKRKIPIALGTDSLASNEELSMLREMRLLKENYPSLNPSEILEMATLNGAKALRLEKEIGSIEKGKKADLIAVPVKNPDPYENISLSQNVSFLMIAGKIEI